MSEVWVMEAEAAERLSVSPGLLRKWRRKGGGPSYVKFGRAIRYSLADLRAFVEVCRVDGEAPPEQL